MEQSRKSEASRTIRVEGFQQLIDAVNKLSDAIVKPDEAKKWQIVAWKTFLQLSKTVLLEEFVKSSIVELEKLDSQDELTEHDEGKLIAYHEIAEKMEWKINLKDR